MIKHYYQAKELPSLVLYDSTISLYDTII